MGKLSTPEWIKEGFDSKVAWQQSKDLVPSSPKRGQTKEKSQGKKVSAKKPGKKFKLKVCPKCSGSDVKVVLGGEEGKGDNGWTCESCSWKSKEPEEKEVSEEEFLEHIERMEGK